VLNSKVLVMGITFKENVSDLRNSRVADVVTELRTYGVNVEMVDPYANAKEVKEEYGFTLMEKAGTGYDAVIVAVGHKPYMELDESYFLSITSENAVLVDVKGMYRNKINKLTYWSL
jgi:UDP-N-acetyl-D-glucosamine/UDP-N-acetyl-D-galactosamine dehydrogenase